MKNLLLLICIILLSPAAYSYVSPESYAVNEADFMDYTRIAPPRKLDLDALDNNGYQPQNIIESNYNIENNQVQTEVLGGEITPKSNSDEKKELEPYQKKFSYKFAKWWVDQRYKREEEHHGSLHEIKVNKRIEYEKRLQEEKEKASKAE